MKKIKLLTGLSTLSVLGLSTLPLTSCNNVKFTVHFNTNGGSEIADIKVNKDSTITKPADPIRKGYTFVAGYSDEGLTKEFDFTTRVTSDLTLYAGGIEAEAISESDFMALYTSYYNTFINSAFEYTKDDIVLYGNGEIEEITDVSYDGDPKICSVVRGPKFSIVAGRSIEGIQEIIDAADETAFYKSNDNIWYGCKKSDLEETYTCINKFGYDVFHGQKQASGYEPTIYLAYKKDPTK